MDLKTYTERERGTAARLARDLKVPAVLISQWASGARPIPEDRAPDLEFFTDFQVTAEECCPPPLSKWVRVQDPAWPNGKPLLDKASAPVDVVGGHAAIALEAPTTHAQASRSKSDRPSIHREQKGGR